VFDDDKGAASLFKNRHDLEYYEGPADLQVLESAAVQPALDGGAVAANVETL
jgi:hypothetical protein